MLKSLNNRQSVTLWGIDPVTPRDELVELAHTLAVWVRPSPTTKIHLFGSRVRGDHKPSSDVDIVVQFGNCPITDDLMWWSAVNDDLFKAINALLPGPLHILEYNDPVVSKVLAARVIHHDGRVFCVWLEPKL